MTRRFQKQFTEKFSIVFLLCTVFLSGCDIVSEILTDYDDEMIDPAPVGTFTIEGINAPGEVHAGARGVELTATVTSDANVDSDALNYAWDGPGWFTWEKGEAEWDAPIDMGTATITLTVDDGAKNAVTSTIAIDIIQALMVPGREAAGIRLGDGIDKVIMLHGEPDNLDDFGFFSYWLSDKGISGILDGIGLVDSLFIGEPNTSLTVGGNGIGSHVSSVESELGMAGEVDDDDGTEQHWYWEIGINFDYDADSNVESIFIFKPIGGYIVNGAQYRETTPSKEQIRNNKAKLKALAN